MKLTSKQARAMNALRKNRRGGRRIVPWTCSKCMVTMGQRERMVHKCQARFMAATLREAVANYLSGAIQIGALEELLFSLPATEETELSRRLTGLLAESSHAHWSESDVREEILRAIGK